MGQYMEDSKILIKYMKTERSKKHLIYLGDYQIGQSLTVDMTKARTVEPYLVGRNMMRRGKAWLPGASHPLIFPSSQNYPQNKLTSSLYSSHGLGWDSSRVKGM
jgi:hypothetical protein